MGSEAGISIDDCIFAVVDVETTGVFAKGNDRIIEIAVIRVSPSGEIEDEYTTLVNPDRDLGPTGVHGITAADVVGAPSFGEVAGDVLERIRGAVVVGHNVRFDKSFVEAEFARVGTRLPGSPTICTLALTRRLVPELASRNLGHCCEHLGIRLEDAHTALSDARATAGLFATLVERARGSDPPSLQALGCDEAPTPADHWPSIAPTGRSLRRDQVQARLDREIPYLVRLVDRIEDRAEGDGDVEAYLQLLDRVLEDRLVTEQEVEDLFSVANEWGLGRDRAQEAHHAYLRALVRSALEDDVVTDAERRDLCAVTRLLGFTEAGLDKMLDDERAARIGSLPADSSSCPSGEDLAGKSVCFTGALISRIDGAPISRADAERFAREAGLEVKKGVTKKLDLLVVADPNSLSGKAKKARQYGTRVIAEAVFWQMIGVAVE